MTNVLTEECFNIPAIKTIKLYPEMCLKKHNYFSVFITHKVQDFCQKVVHAHDKNKFKLRFLAASFSTKSAFLLVNVQRENESDK